MMIAFRKSLLVGTLALGLGAGSFAAHANRPDGGPDGHWQERMEQRAAKLHDALKLDSSQEAAWNAYVARMKLAGRPQRPDRAAIESMPAPERMEQMLGFMQQREQRFAQRVAATKDFYAVLTPEQKKIFDQQFGPGRHGHRPHHGRQGEQAR